MEGATDDIVIVRGTSPDECWAEATRRATEILGTVPLLRFQTGARHGDEWEIAYTYEAMFGR